MHRIFLSKAFTVELDLLFAEWKMQKITNKNSDELPTMNYITQTGTEKAFNRISLLLSALLILKSPVILDMYTNVFCYQRVLLKGVAFILVLLYVLSLIITILGWL